MFESENISLIVIYFLSICGGELHVASAPQPSTLKMRNLGKKKLTNRDLTPSKLFFTSHPVCVHTQRGRHYYLHFNRRANRCREMK